MCCGHSYFRLFSNICQDISLGSIKALICFGGDKLILEKVFELCEKNDISIAKLEKECEIGNGTIKRWETSMPSLKSLEKISVFFKVPISYFLEN